MTGAFRDISAEVFGKYQYCTLHTDGLFYADCDMLPGRQLRPGALPNPWQFEAAAQARATAMHEAAAKEAVDQVLAALAPKPRRRSLIARFVRWMRGLA